MRLRSDGHLMQVQRSVKPSFQNLFKRTDACGCVTTRAAFKLDVGNIRVDIIRKNAAIEHRGTLNTRAWLRAMHDPVHSCNQQEF